MDRFFHHVLRGLVVVLGLAPLSALAQATIEGCVLTGTAPNQQWTCSDEGLALAQIDRRISELNSNPTAAGLCTRYGLTAAAYTGSMRNFRASGLYRVEHTCTRIVDTPPTVFAWTSPSGWNPVVATFTVSCSTRPDRALSWTGGENALACDRGCEVTTIGAFGVTVCSWSGPQGSRVYQCAGPMRATGRTCHAGPTVSSGPRPSDPDRDGDGTPNSGDDAPDDPGCQVNCGPQPPPPPPQPPPPDDGSDDGAQLAQELGPALDAIEQAVLGLGIDIAGVTEAIEGARADANADADGIRSALDGIRSAIVAQGPNAGSGEGPGEGDGPPDLSPLNPGPDGGEHPALGSIVEQGDAGQLLGQLDTDGFGFGRSCPAYAWPLSFDLGWANINIQQSVGIVCTALAILGFIIGLAGLIQASFILGRIGAT